MYNRYRNDGLDSPSSHRPFFISLIERLTAYLYRNTVWNPYDKHAGSYGALQKTKKF